MTQPSDETLAAFIDGRLDAKARADVMEHVATCAECYDVVLAADALREPARNLAPFRRARWAALASAAAAAIALIAFFLVPRSRSSIADLAAAAPAQRNTVSRLAGFPYRPLAVATRGAGEEDNTPEQTKLLKVAAKVAVNAKRNPTAENLHAYGISLLMMGHGRAAVNTLEAAVAKEGATIANCSDAALLNDLSAAAYAAGDVAAAVAASGRAYRLDDHSPEIAWNRALAFEAARDRAAAVKAWHDYLRIDPAGSWSAEARSHL